MGWSNFIVVPKYKLMFEFDRGAGEDKIEDIKSRLEALCKLDEDNDMYEILEKRHDKLTLKEQAVIVQYAGKASMLASDLNEAIIAIAMGDYDPDCRVITDSSEEFSKLTDSGYAAIRYHRG